MREIPFNWISLPLEQLTEQITKGTTPTTLGFKYEASGVNFVKIENINKSKIQASSINQFISAEAHEALSRSILKEHDILFSIAGTIGKTALVSEKDLPANTNQAIAIIRLASSIADHRFIQYQLNTLPKDFLSEKSRGGAMANISLADIKGFEACIAPLNEQSRIAQKLDELLAQVDALKTRIDSIPALVKRFRQSVLAAAVSGQLTGAGCKSAEHEALPLSPLVFSERDQVAPPDGWHWKLLTDLGKLESGHTPRKSVSAYWEGGDVPWISLQDIRAADGKEIIETKYMPTALGIENSSARLLPKGTVCFSRDISVGFVTIMGRSMATTQHFANWVCGKKLLPKYLMYSFMAGRDHLLQSGQGSTVKTIYMPALKELRLLLPPIAEQTEIVHRIEQLFAFADQLEDKVASAKTRIDHLTQSILAKAFRGELVPQDPNDEPASVLLDRIKAQRTAAPKAKRTRKAAG